MDITRNTTTASTPGHDIVCACNRCILARVTIREDRRSAERRATARPESTDRRQAPEALVIPSKSEMILAMRMGYLIRRILCAKPSRCRRPRPSPAGVVARPGPGHIGS